VEHGQPLRVDPAEVIAEARKSARELAMRARLI